ncbi:MAG TPA: FMN-binding protein [Spirochaetota bacterium]|jgi:electron transport complex protein RnfG|nr:MAG: electron transport complex protein RnfG [Spirochaetes bacterium ADurb.Bin133]HNZ27004.1 FMN-binding protein [Spirochaetota bacterium]HPY86870.1 FMN-binding protein [Spirochaetota bacterium]
MKDDLIIALKLAAICFVSVLLLSFVNLITYKRINESNVKVENDTNKELISDGKFFEKKHFKSPNFNSTNEYYYIVKNDKMRRIGYTVVVICSGYGGEMKVMCATDNNYKILNMKLLNNSETPGIGKSAEKDSYMQKFIGTNTPSSPFPFKKSMLSKEDGDSITGATITFNGIALGVQRALTALDLENKE